MRYSVPLTALKVTALVVLGYRTSSLEATRLSALTVVPIWTPRSVSNGLPAVLKVTVPLAGAPQRNQRTPRRYFLRGSAHLPPWLLPPCCRTSCRRRRQS